MANVLLTIGIILIVGSFLFRPKKESQYNASSVEAFQEDFFEQFKMSQTKLESLYAFDFSEVCAKLDEIEVRLDELQGTVSQLSLDGIQQQLNLLAESLSPKEQTQEQENLTNMTTKTSEKILEYLELKNQGKSLDEIVKILHMEKGELLFLENLSKSITNS